jgi:hypothetical protein
MMMMMAAGEIEIGGIEAGTIGIEPLRRDSGLCSAAQVS